jgi:hypothetical protein
MNAALDRAVANAMGLKSVNNCEKWGTSMTDKEAMKLALEALENQIANVYDTESNAYKKCLPAITALKERLADPMREVQRLGQEIEQEPVAWMHIQGNYQESSFRQLDDWEIKNGFKQYPLYATPPQRTEQNFCSRCGKRTPDLITIHTCTPPKEKNNV